MSTQNEGENPLTKIIHQTIAQTGPLSLPDYMSLCLFHTEHGYYRSAKIFGAKGDFITAPEISQLFGEMVGAWVLTQWIRLGEPRDWHLVELGPGRGTLMKDVLRVLKGHPTATSDLTIKLLETHPDLKVAQEQALNGQSADWIAEIDELADLDAPIVCIANEFFDAMPIRQFQMTDEKWHEREIGLRNGELAWGLSETPIDAATLPAGLGEGAQEGEICEIGLPAQNLMANLAQIIKQKGGAFLTFDYGYLKTQLGDTFQALRNNEFADPLIGHGQTDLTAHVNFENLAQTAANAGIAEIGLTSQGELLSHLGIKERAEVLVAQNPSQAEKIKSGLERLIADDQMGQLFKAMIMFEPTPPPFRTSEILGEQSAISHGFFGRQGGVSQAPFDTLNISLSNADTPENAKENRRRICAALAIQPKHLATVRQVHSAKVVHVDDNFNFDNSIDADALVTKRPGVGLAISTADCTPVLFFDPVTKTIGACHAGWKGAVDNIVEATIAAMADLGSERKNIIAAVGPNISFDNYEVGPEFAQMLKETHPDAADCIALPAGKTREHFDLTKFVQRKLEQAAITNFDTIDACTYALQEQYFSHRFATHQVGDTGRQMSVIALR